MFTSILTLIIGVAVAAHAQDSTPPSVDSPPFEWTDGYASPGVALSISQGTRIKASVDYKLKAEGFDPEHDLVLWFKRGSQYGGVHVTLLLGGVVRMDPNDLHALETSVGPVYIDPRERTLSSSISQEVSLRGIFSRGEALDIALWDVITGKRAHAKDIPFPIHSSGKNGCEGSAEQIDREPLKFLIRLTGFRPGSDVTVTRRVKSDVKRNSFTASEQGEVLISLQVAAGKVNVQASDGECQVSLNFVPGPPRL